MSTSPYLSFVSNLIICYEGPNQICMGLIYKNRKYSYTKGIINWEGNQFIIPPIIEASSSNRSFKQNWYEQCENISFKSCLLIEFLTIYINYTFIDLIFVCLRIL